MLAINKILARIKCASLRTAIVLSGARKHKTSRQKAIAFCWRFIFIIIIIIYFTTGLSPFAAIEKMLYALTGNTETINLYASSCYPEKQSQDYNQGWWGAAKVSGPPDLPPTAGLLSFNDSNSGFYSGGDNSLICGGFMFLAADVNQLTATGSPVTSQTNNSANSKDTTNNANTANILTSPNLTASNSPAGNGYSGQTDTDTASDSPAIGGQATTTATATTTNRSGSENSDKQTPSASSSPEAPSDIENNTVIVPGPSVPDNTGNDQAVSGPDRLNSAVQPQPEANTGQGTVEVVPTQPSANNVDIITNPDGQNDQSPAVTGDGSAPTDAAPVTSVPADPDPTSPDTASPPADNSGNSGKDVSLLDKIRDSLTALTARAQEFLSAKITSLDQLGQFKSARIKLSLAMFSHMSTANIQTDNGNISPISGTNTPGQTGTNSNEFLPGNGSVTASGTPETGSSTDAGTAVTAPGATGDNPGQTKVNAANEASGSVEIINRTNNTQVEINNPANGGKAATSSGNDPGPSSQDATNTPVSMLPRENRLAKANTATAGRTGGLKASSGETGASNPLDRFFKAARAQTDQLDAAKLVIWYSLDSGSSTAPDASADTNLLWQKLDTITGSRLSNALSNGYLSYNADFLDSWDAVNKLKIKIEGVVSGQGLFTAYLDSVWVEAVFEPSSELSMIKKRQNWQAALQLVSNRLAFGMNEAGEFKFRYTKNQTKLLDSLGQMVGITGFWNDVDISAQLIDDKSNVVPLPLTMIFDNDGEFTVKLPQAPRSFRPGLYSIRFTIQDDSGSEPETFEFKQDFSWGVLAINTDKSVYQPMEQAYLQMAVLDNSGNTVCNADLDLDVTSPSGITTKLSTMDGTIISNPACGPNNVIDSPDYYAYYDTAGAGVYTMDLTATTTNGVKRISDNFEVSDTVPFSIERIGPTRIYPWANYDMRMKIKANENFNGDIRETVPQGFAIVDNSALLKSASSSDQKTGNWKLEIKDGKNETKYLTWKDVSLKTDDEMDLSYTFDAPNVSPEFYLLGPLELIPQADPSSPISEVRAWQIAADATSTYSGTNGLNVSWTNPTYAWDGSGSTYASRSIPKKNVDDSANYLEMTDDNASDIGGNITKVEIGIDGYVQNTAVTTHLVPSFNGTTDGAGTYTISGATLGTTDDGVPNYVDITGDANGPGAANWTWNDIINLNIRLYGQDTSNGSNYYLYVSDFRIRVTYTPNTAPTSTIISAIERKDASGVADISIDAGDTNGDPLKAKLEYATGTTCDFSSPGKATLDTTDANATSTYGDAKIDDNSDYQIGTTSGWIITASGTNTVNFDWLSKTDIPDAEGTYCLRLTANDGYADQVVPATTTIEIDNKPPTAPGALVATNTTKNSLTLAFGATSTDAHFAEYRIYYATSTPVNESSHLFGSSSDANLAAGDLNGATSTTITGLAENTEYYFALWAYDEYGNKSSSTLGNAITNSAPDAVFTAAMPPQERTDGSGVVDLAIDVFDKNYDDTKAKLEFSAGANCNFSPSSDPTLDENQTDIQATYGVPKINNSNTYQIGNSSGWILTNATNTVQFSWYSGIDLNNLEGTYCLRLTANDNKDDQDSPATTTLTIDNKAPSAPGPLTNGGVGTSTITLAYGATSTDADFYRYRIYYKIGTSSVTEGLNGESEVSDSNLNYSDFNHATSTTVSGLTPDSYYTFKIWAYDQFGHEASSSETVIKTNAAITNDSLVFTNPAVANYAIADSASAWDFRAVVSDDKGYDKLNTVTLRLADFSDNVSPYDDLAFTWTQSTGAFTETGSDLMSAAVLSGDSTSTCADKSCTLDFKIIFDYTFANFGVDYNAELYSTNNNNSADEDTYDNIYQMRITRVDQIHYRWRNNDGGE